MLHWSKRSVLKTAVLFSLCLALFCNRWVGVPLEWRHLTDHRPCTSRPFVRRSDSLASGWMRSVTLRRKTIHPHGGFLLWFFIEMLYHGWKHNSQRWWSEVKKPNKVSLKKLKNVKVKAVQAYVLFIFTMKPQHKVSVSNHLKKT